MALSASSRPIASDLSRKLFGFLEMAGRHRQREPGLREVAGHGQTHRAQANETDGSRHESRLAFTSPSETRGLR